MMGAGSWPICLFVGSGLYLFADSLGGNRSLIADADIVKNFLEVALSLRGPNCRRHFQLLPFGVTRFSTRSRTVFKSSGFERPSRLCSSAILFPTSNNRS